MKSLTRNINGKVLRIAVPSIFANITVPLVGMSDLAIAGRLGNTASIGAVAIAAMLFDLLYWNMGFLRTGTGGFTAQGLGRKDIKAITGTFIQGVGTAIGMSLIILSIQWIYAEAAFKFIKCTPEVEKLARDYFFIRIWAAPATLSLYVFKGWFIGMQNSVFPMITDITVNVTNIGASIYFAFFTPMGFPGIALGTLIAQYTGLILASFLMARRYGKLYKGAGIRENFRPERIRKFFAVNRDLFIRSLCILGVYAGFTSLSANYGEIQLAVGSIMMKLMMLFSYFVDGYAYAGEALAGKYIGARDKEKLIASAKVVFMWSMAIGIAFTAAYMLEGESMMRMLTSEKDVIAAAEEYMPWLIIMPVMSCAAFTWDGIYIGAAASKEIRNCMILSVAGFFAGYYMSRPFMEGINPLWAGYTLHLLIRTAYMSAKAKPAVFNRQNAC